MLHKLDSQPQEIYTGNLLLQRFFIENHLTKLTKRNHGELPMYKVLETHEPIISEEKQRRTPSVLC